MLKYAMNEATTLNWPLERDLDYYAARGVPAVSLQIPKLQAYGIDKAVQLVRDCGMAPVCLLSTGFFTLADPSRWPKQIEAARKAIDVAGRIGAESVNVISGPPGDLSYEEAEPRFVEILGKLIPYAEQAGVVLSLEPNHALRMDLGYIHSHHDALDLADLVDSPWFKITVEMNNVWIERRLYENIRARWRRIGVVQVNDFKAGTHCTPARVPPGDGIIPLRRILGAFRDAGYTGYYDIELVGPDIEEMGYEEAVRRSLAWVRALEGF